MATKKKKKQMELKIVFDTNAIFTDLPAFLVKLEIKEIIRANSSHPDLKVSWYLPEVVRWEREFQMRENGFLLLPAIAKIEKVLKHNLGITEQTIIERVPTLVDEQLKDLGLGILSFDHKSIDWPRLVQNAASRKAPFEKGEKEKGFRDAIILESFSQLVQASPKSAASCLIALVARDGRLIEAAKERTSGAKNVRFVEDVSALKGLINTLVAQVDEDFVQSVQENATTYFFEYDEKNPQQKVGLLYRANVLQQLEHKYKKEVNLVPAGYDGADKGVTFMNSARFSRKERRRIFWVTRIQYEYKPYHWQVSGYYGPQFTKLGAQGATGPTGPTGPQGPAGAAGISGYSGFSGLGAYQGWVGTPPVSGTPPPAGPGPLSLDPWRNMEKAYGPTGRISFDVTWSVLITTQQHKFTSPRIEEIVYVSNA